MGRKKLSAEEKKQVLNVLMPGKVIDLLSPIECKEIAEEAILKEYKRVLKTKPND